MEAIVEAQDRRRRVLLGMSGLIFGAGFATRPWLEQAL